VASDSTAIFPESLVGPPDAATSEPDGHTDGRTEAEELSATTARNARRNDEMLLTAVGHGSKDALGPLFRRHRRSVLNVAARILKDASEAEDLCQEVFLVVFQKAKSFDPSKGTASSWIIQIAYSRALNRRQYLTMRQHYNARELNEEQIEERHCPVFVDGILARSLLKRLREQLSEEQRSTLELHFFEGYSLREIAEKTDQTIGNVRHHYYRGLERLRSNVFPQKDI
jgi:RNA polymerase sigma-70 factor, ECF subfamily